MKDPLLFGVRASGFVALFVLVLCAVDQFLIGPALTCEDGSPWRWTAENLHVWPGDAEAVFGEASKLNRSEGRLLCLGDSVVNFYDGLESARINLSGALSRDTAADLVDASHPAYDASMFLAQSRYLIRHGIRPRLVTIGINLRSFSPFWYDRYTRTFATRVAMLSSERVTSLRLLQVFKVGHVKVRDEARDLPIRIDGVEVGSFDEFFRPDLGARVSQAVTANRYRAAYATSIRQSPVFRELQDLARVLAESALPHLLYVTPIDLEGMRSCASDNDMEPVRDNLWTLVEALQESGVRFIDLSEVVGRDGFTHPTTNPDEHLTARSINLVAARIVAAARAR